MLYQDLFTSIDCQWAIVRVGISGNSILCPLKVSFYLYHYTTISKTLDIFLRPVHYGMNLQSLMKVSLYTAQRMSTLNFVV